ncbi:hypothetical protein WJX73_005004 [Symbiochloris irregularis]|uniref:Uncharacterized protein n=1 Tax=Symbiochloris irregularis TaxID=706552 RepID=A0AAW1NVD3_9CHLO
MAGDRCFGKYESYYGRKLFKKVFGRTVHDWLASPQLRALAAGLDTDFEIGLVSQSVSKARSMLSGSTYLAGVSIALQRRRVLDAQSRSCVPFHVRKERADQPGNVEGLQPLDVQAAAEEVTTVLQGQSKLA